MKWHIFSALCFVPMLLSCGREEPPEEAHTNHLIHESSPYLLQHAHNPVDWFPWGEAALEKARMENKLLIISVGYSACHWCHVMERESFEDTTVARFMNEHFVSIKVDREERPDIDDLYLTACQLATDRGCGWPLHAFALPDGRPVWAGTYFPRKEWMAVMEYFVQLYRDEPEKLSRYAADLTQGVQELGRLVPAAQGISYDSSALRAAVNRLLEELDYERGGRRGSPKFPLPNLYEFLLAYQHYSGDARALEAVEVSLQRMAAGGIYDQLGGGFARYSTDANWLVPHFEKMLYDNAQLVSLYAHAYQRQANPFYRQVIEQTLDFVARELTATDGSFYSSLDADSDGQEGSFYVWRQEEVDSILGDAALSALFSEYYGLEAEGNWDAGRNVLYRHGSGEALARRSGRLLAELEEAMADARARLWKAREERVRPGLDDKVLTSWNALMLQAYVDAYRALGAPEYLEAAEGNARFLLATMKADGRRLNRNFKEGASVVNAFLDDYAFLIQALISLYESTFDEQWLYEARGLADYVLAHFADSDSPLFFYTSDLDPPLVARRMEVADNVMPASNSAFAHDLWRLGHYFYDSTYLQRAAGMLQAVWTEAGLRDEPGSYANWCRLYQQMLSPPLEVAIVGPEAGARRDELMRHYLPQVQLLGGRKGGTLELLEGKYREGETLIYVCREKVCKLPVGEVAAALDLIAD